MDILQWKELVTVIECGSLTEAAKRLGYTLSGISRSMAGLEKEVGFTLLYRSKKGVSPTGDCLRLMPYVRELLYSEEKLSQICASVRGAEQGTIKIGTAYRHYYKWLTEVTSDFHALHPGVHFQITTGTSTEFAGGLENHELDFCLISERVGTHDWYPLCRDKLIALLSQNHPLAKKKTLEAAVFAKEAYVQTCPGLDIDSTRYFDGLGIAPNVQFATMDIQATYAMVEAGMGISITNEINSLPDFPGICHRKLKPEQTIEIGLACAKKLPPAAEAFLKFIIPRLPHED